MKTDEKLIDALVSGLLHWVLQLHMSGDKESAKCEEVRAICLLFDVICLRSLAGANKQQSKVLAIKFNAAMLPLSRYIRNELKDTRKSMRVLIEWFYSLHDAGAISIDELGCGDELNRIDEILQAELDSEGKIQKSIDKHVLKLHALACRFVSI